MTSPTERITPVTKAMTKAPNPTHHTTNTPNVAHEANQTPTTRLTFTVPGKPAPQGSKRHIGNGRMIESSQAVGPWRERVALTAHNAMNGHPLLTGPITINIDFVLHRPISTPKRTTPPATKKPDLDKLARAILDAITHTVIADDSQVTHLCATKRLAEIGETPAAHITVASK